VARTQRGRAGPNPFQCIFFNLGHCLPASQPSPTLAQIKPRCRACARRGWGLSKNPELGAGTGIGGELKYLVEELDYISNNLLRNPSWGVITALAFGLAITGKLAKLPRSEQRQLWTPGS
jgi:hypothetical protein